MGQLTAEQKAASDANVARFAAAREALSPEDRSELERLEGAVAAAEASFDAAKAARNADLGNESLKEAQKNAAVAWAEARRQLNAARYRFGVGEVTRLGAI